MEIATHIDGLGRLLELERTEERERLRRAREALTAEQRQQSGLVLLDLKVADVRSLAGRFLVTFVPTRPGQELGSQRPGAGAIVQVVRRRPEEDDEKPSGVIARRSRLEVQVAFDQPVPEWMEEGAVNLELLPNDVTYERQRAGLGRLRSGKERHLERWRELLSGKRAPDFDAHLPFTPTDALNPEQNDALRLALSAKELALIHGPPGTGKTTVLAELIVQSVRRGEKVLASAASNTAVDNLLERLVAEGLKVVRLGHVARVSEELLPWTLDEQIQANASQSIAKELLDQAHGLLTHARKQIDRGRSRERYQNAREARKEASELFKEARRMMRGVREQIIESAQVVCATCAGTEVELLEGTLFDLAVVDEATQATEPAALLPVLRARRAVLAGDHHQLPPTVLSQAASNQGLSRSLFERMLETHGPAIAKMLREQHRMNEQIMRFPSQQLYGGELRAHPTVANHLLADLPHVSGESPGPLQFLDTAGKGFDEEIAPGTESTRNPGEAELVVREVRKLLALGVRPEELAVIAPYDAQVQTIRALLPDAALEIDTVDGFQGREREAVVVSLTRSNPDAQVGFLSDIRRMNVAITRARRHLLVIGDSATVSSHPFYSAFLDEVTAAGGYRSAWDEPE